jgi:hypothetical protein
MDMEANPFRMPYDFSIFWNFDLAHLANGLDALVFDDGLQSNKKR